MNTETFTLKTLSAEAQIKKFGEVKITPDTEMELVCHRSKYARVEDVDFCKNDVTEWIHVAYDDEINPELFIHLYANYHGYSDVHPFEVVKHNTALKMTVREMDAKLKEGSKPEIIPGGFAGHCVNNRSLEYDYTSNPENGEKEIRYSKAKRGWFDKHGARFMAARAPYKFHDYNF